MTTVNILISFSEIIAEEVLDKIAEWMKLAQKYFPNYLCFKMRNNI